VGYKVNIQRFSAERRVRIAGTLVLMQFTMLGVITTFAVTEVTAVNHQYLAFELAAVALGLLVIAGAGISLRPSLRVSPIPKSGAPLIESGIYKRVRHPMYLGVILIGFGLAGYANSTIPWICELILVLALNIKARFEDALLLEIHPESAHYQMHVSRILPCMGGSCRTTCIVK
jgi:protein-S-isoprenylcysteine O-methyltransferase Ste14